MFAASVTVLAFRVSAFTGKFRVKFKFSSHCWPGQVESLSRPECVRTYYKAVRVGGGGEWRTCAMRDDEPRPVWMSLLITH